MKPIRERWLIRLLHDIGAAAVQLLADFLLKKLSKKVDQ